MTKTLLEAKHSFDSLPPTHSLNAIRAPDTLRFVATDNDRGQSSSPGLHFETIEQRLVFGFLLVTGILVLVAWIAIRSSMNSRSASDQVRHTHAILLDTAGFLSAMEASESALRSYVLSGLDIDLERWQRETNRALVSLGVAQSMAQAENSSLPGWERLAQLSSEMREVGARVVESRRREGLEASRLLLLGSPAYEHLLELRRQVSALTQKENERLLTRDQRAHQNEAMTRRVIGTGLMINFALLALGFWLIRDDLRLRRIRAFTLAKSNELLEQKVFERTAEITKANAALEVENLERQWAFHALERHQRHNELIIHAVEEGVIVASSTGVVLRANRAAEKLTALTHDELIGRRLLSLLVPPGSWDESNGWRSHPVAQALQTGQNSDPLELLLVGKDATQRRCACRIQPLLDGGKVVAGILCFKALEPKLP